MPWKRFGSLLAISIGASKAFAAAASPAPLTAKDVLNHLNQVIALYQRIDAADQAQSAPQNLLLKDNVRQSAARAVQLAFAFARAEAAILDTSGQSSDQTTAAPAESRTLQQAAVTADQRVSDLQSRIETLNKQIEKEAGRQRTTLISQRDAFAAYLDLAKESQQAIKNMMSFASGPNTGTPGAGLLQQIDDLANSDSVPAALNGVQKSSSSSAQVADGFHPESAGIEALLSRKVSLGRSRSQVDSIVTETDALLAEIDTLKTPLRADLRSAISDGNAIASTAGTQSDPEKLAAARQQINSLAARFKNSEKIMTPLGEEGIVLRGSRYGLVQWRSALQEQDNAILRNLAVRLGVLVLAVALILVFSRVWHKGIFKYVREPRRRRQLMLIRRFVVGLGVALVVSLGFLTSFGSVATFVGFLTAGLALALQNVILSVVAYFFLIGRYGLRVGDRLSVSGVTGQVIEIGLVRFFMMELAGTGADVHPTGRVAAWSNSMIFQPYSWLKQAPGTEYAWHLIAMTFTPEADHDAARARVTAAVDAVYQSYRISIEEQHAAFEQSINMPTPAPKPVTRVHFTDAGCEIFVRYPVEFDRGANIDDQVLARLRQEIEKEPKLRLASGGAPKLQAAMV